MALRNLSEQPVEEAPSEILLLPSLITTIQSDINSIEGAMWYPLEDNQLADDDFTGFVSLDSQAFNRLYFNSTIRDSDRKVGLLITGALNVYRELFNNPPWSENISLSTAAQRLSNQLSSGDARLVIGLDNVRSPIQSVVSLATFEKSSPGSAVRKVANTICDYAPPEDTKHNNLEQYQRDLLWKIFKGLQKKGVDIQADNTLILFHEFGITFEEQGKYQKLRNLLRFTHQVMIDLIDFGQDPQAPCVMWTEKGTAMDGLAQTLAFTPLAVHKGKYYDKKGNRVLEKELIIYYFTPEKPLLASQSKAAFFQTIRKTAMEQLIRLNVTPTRRLIEVKASKLYHKIIRSIGELKGHTPKDTKEA